MTNYNFIFFIFVAKLIASIQTKLHFTSEQNSKLEVHCIEEYGKYCDGKLAGFRFNDGCRICKCNNDVVLCKKGPCQFFTKMDQDALDYCDKILLKNKNAYKLYKRQQRTKSTRGKDSLGTNADSTAANQPQLKQLAERVVMEALKQHLDDQLINDHNTAYKTQKARAETPDISYKGVDREAPIPNLVAVNDYKDAFAQPARSTISDIGQGKIVPTGKMSIESVKIPAPMSSQQNSNGMDAYSPTLPQHKQQQQKQQQQQQPRHVLPNSEILKMDGKLLAKSTGSTSKQSNFGPAALPPNPPQRSQPLNVIQNMQASGRLGELPIVKLPMQGPPGPYVKQHNPNEGQLPPKFQLHQPMQPIEQLKTNGAPKSGMDRNTIFMAADKQLQAGGLPKSGILKSDGSIVQPSKQSLGAQNMQDNHRMPISNLGMFESLPIIHRKENRLPAMLKQDLPYSSLSQKPPRDGKTLLVSGHYAISEFEDENGQKFIKLPSQQFDQLIHLSEGSLFTDHARLDKMFDQQTQAFKEPHQHQAKQPLHWRPMNYDYENLMHSSFNVAPERDSDICDGVQQYLPPPSPSNSFYGDFSPLYYGPEPYAIKNPWVNNWQDPGGFLRGAPMHHWFGNKMYGPWRLGEEAIKPTEAMTNWKEDAINIKQSFEKKEEEMSEKVKNLLELTKSAIRVLIRANQTEYSTLKWDTNSSSADNATITIIPGAEVNQEIEELRSIVNDMKGLVPRVEELVKKDSDEEGEKEIVFEPTKVVMLSSFGNDEADDTHEHNGNDHDEVPTLREKLANCEYQFKKLLQILNEKESPQVSPKSDDKLKDRLLSLLSVLKPLV